ncbi:MAG: peptide ABC transporter substrate-binding protein [Anaerolineales bacterium]|nr:peptide ABC transporter substrate-binding protein [Anaerolineales bacterium]
MSKKIMLLFTILALAAVLSACGGAAQPAPAEKSQDAPAANAPAQEEAAAEAAASDSSGSGEVGDPFDRVTLRATIGSDPPTLDPALVTDTTSNFFVRQMFVGLTKFDQKAEVEPSLATEWDVSEDGLQWTFKLRDDINWVRRSADGKYEAIRPVVAGDVVYAVKRAVDPNTASDYAYVLYYIKGAEEANTADPETANMEELLANVGVEAPDDTTVVFTLNAPAAYFPSIAALSTTYPVPQEAVEEFGEKWIEPGNIITNGPYALLERNYGASLYLEKNPLWIDADNVQIEVYGGPVIAEASTEMALYESNEIDVMGSDPGWGPPLPDMDRIKADPELSQELYIAPKTCTYYYGFVMTKPPFDNPDVRKAFSLVIDRQSLIDNVLKGEQIPAHSFVPPGVFGNVADNMEIGAELLADYGDRISEAQSLLADAGFPEGEGLDVVLGHNTSESHAQIAQAIQAMWQEAFPKAQITIENQEWAVYLDTMDPTAPDENKPDIYRSAWCTDYPDANNWHNEVFNSKSAQNYSKFFNDDYDALSLEAAFETDPAKRQKIYAEEEKMLVDEYVAIAPIYYYSSIRMFKPWVTPVLSPISGDPISEWRIDVDAQRAALK